MMRSRGASTEKTHGEGSKKISEGSQISHSRSTSTIMSRSDCLSRLTLRADHNTYKEVPKPSQLSPGDLLEATYCRPGTTS